MSSVLVVTVVHHPDDSRIRFRQIGALLDAGWEVTYAAPWSGYGVTPPHGIPGLSALDLPRSRGRRRLGALRAARALLRTHAPSHDVVLLHDPELLAALPGLDLPPVVWDVHEDTAAAVEVKRWVPAPLRRPVAGAVRAAERVAEGKVHLLLADHAYAGRFTRSHPVVPNVTAVPADPPPAATPRNGRQRVVYVGSITLERGAAEMVQIARQLPEHIRVELVGQAHGPAQALLEQAREEGLLDWAGFVPGAQAMARVEGALAGLCLLHDEANFRPSMATKVVEYLSRGVPAIVTPLPVQRALVEASGGGAVVPFGATTQVVDLLTSWAADPELPRSLGRAGHAYVARHHDWGQVQHDFLGALEGIARSAR